MGMVRRNNPSAPPEAIPVPGAVGAAQMEPNLSFGQQVPGLAPALPERATRNPCQGHSWKWVQHRAQPLPVPSQACRAECSPIPSSRPAHQEVSPPPGVSLRCCPASLRCTRCLQGRAQQRCLGCGVGAISPALLPWPQTALPQDLSLASPQFPWDSPSPVYFPALLARIPCCQSSLPGQMWC